MMKKGLSKFTRRLLHRGQTGQTIVILAFGFIVLLGFVGIVTDVSLMFVRYSTLRRAIDAAAVSAAGQMRRAIPNPDELARAEVDGGGPEVVARRAQGYAFARNIANVNLAARQFIELYGLSPTTVVVDTCATTEILPRTDPPMYRDPQLECGVGEQPRKLVRVTAQVDSPTVFLRLLGWGTVTLEATAISETAVLDVVMIFDVSESMLNQTSYEDWGAVPQADGSTIDYSMRYFPPRMASGADYTTGGTVSDTIDKHLPGSWPDAWIYALNTNQIGMDGYVDAGKNIFQGTPFVVTDEANTVKFPAEVDPATRPLEPEREECRVRFFPSAGSFLIPRPNAVTPNEYLPNNDVWQELKSYMNTKLNIPGDHQYYWDGFIPTYNYFGCCNDPNGDWWFSDLVCQPMGDVREASESFLEHIDFGRGDRVGFVTFDRTAHLIDPDGAGTETPMITSQSYATDTLNKNVGVRAEPSYYADTDNDGYWDHYVVGGGAYGGTTPNVDTLLTDDFKTLPLGTLNDYPVKDNCIFQNATLGWPFSVYSSPTSDHRRDLPDQTAPYPPYLSRVPNPFASEFYPIASPTIRTTVMHPNLNELDWMSVEPANVQLNKALYSYELRAACRGSNVGAALRVANNALVDPVTIRTNGAVWVMVMLGDGAAAGSDPVRRNGQNLVVPNVYNGTNTSPSEVQPVAGDYGVYGVCPYGRPNDAVYPRTGMVDDMGSVNWSRDFPYCSDQLPESRHFCFNPNIKDADGNLYIDLALNVDCELKYDVDDFARDWADFIGLSNPFPSLISAEELGRENIQLPTIFTIGFGLDFQSGDHTCAEPKNVSDCLGEELLRYVADVGDNNRVDTDYQQDARHNGVDGLLDPDDEWGPRGSCEGPVNGYPSPDAIPLGANFGDALVNPLPEGQSCGNYFNAPDPQELQDVFDTIASRMFTRLTR
jgi:hypothetical protein